MKHLGLSQETILGMKRSLVRAKRTRDANPTITCTTCMDTGRMRFSTGTVACYCQKGQDLEHEQQQRDWLERVEREVGIPREIRKHVEKGGYDHEITRAIQRSIESNMGSYLYGGVGRGKSVGAAAALLESVRSAGDVRASPRRYGIFTTASDYLQSIRDTYDTGLHSMAGGTGQPDPSGTKLLVLDDVGVERVTDWGAEQITRLIDHRVSAGLPTIFTSNLTLDELERKYNAASYMMGDRVRSRIEGSCAVLHVDGPDWRRAGAGS